MSSTSCQFDHWVLPASQQKRSAATAPALPQRPPQRGGSPRPPEHRSKQTFRHSAAISSPNNRPGSRPSRHIPPQRRCEGSLTAGACLCERPVRPEERQATSALLGLHLQGAVWWKRGHIRPRSKYEICNIEHQKWCWNANANLTQ